MHACSGSIGTGVRLVNLRILAPVVLLLCAALFFVWRSTHTTPHTDLVVPVDVEHVAPKVTAETLAPSSRAPVVEVPRSAAEQARAVVRSGCSIHGRVVDQNGAPIAQRDVWLRPADRRTPVYFTFLPEDSGGSSAASDAEGNFTFDGIAAGCWWIGPSFTAGTIDQRAEQIAAAGQVLVVEDGQKDVDVLIRAGRGLYLRGVLLDKRGIHVNHGLVFARDLESGLQKYTSVNKLGQFDLGPLPPGRSEVVGWSRDDDAPSEAVQANAGDEGIELRMRAGASLSGDILDEHGLKTFASLRIEPRKPSSFPSPVLESLRDGTFAARGLEPGDYDIVATTNTGRIGAIGPIRLSVGEGATGLVVQLSAGGSVRTRFAARESVGFARLIQDGRTIASIELPRDTVQDFGAFVGKATVRIELLETGRVLERECDVLPGQTTKVLFDPDEH